MLVNLIRAHNLRGHERACEGHEPQGSVSALAEKAVTDHQPAHAQGPSRDVSIDNPKKPNSAKDGAVRIRQLGQALAQVEKLIQGPVEDEEPNAHKVEEQKQHNPPAVL